MFLSRSRTVPSIMVSQAADWFVGGGEGERATYEQRNDVDTQEYRTILLGIPTSSPIEHRSANQNHESRVRTSCGSKAVSRVLSSNRRPAPPRPSLAHTSPLVLEVSPQRFPLSFCRKALRKRLQSIGETDVHWIVGSCLFVLLYLSSAATLHTHCCVHPETNP